MQQMKMLCCGDAYRILKPSYAFLYGLMGVFTLGLCKKQMGNSCQYELNETNPSFVNAVTFMSVLFKADANFPQNCFL